MKCPCTRCRRRANVNRERVTSRNGQKSGKHVCELGECQKRQEQDGQYKAMMSGSDDGGLAQTEGEESEKVFQCPLDPPQLTNNSPTIFPSLLHPPDSSQPVTVFAPHFSASRSRRKYSLAFNAPTFSSTESRNIFPSLSALFNCNPRARCQHCHYTRLFYKATLTTPSRRS